MREFLPIFSLGLRVKAWTSSAVAIVQTMGIITVLFGSMAVATMYFSRDPQGAVEGCMRLCEVHFAHAQPLVFRVYGLPVARSPDVDGDSNCFELGIARWPE